MNGWLSRLTARAVSICTISLLAASAAGAQTASDVVRVDLSTGRSYPVQSATPVTNVSVANPEVADVAVVGQRDVVISARTPGETDVLMFTADGARRHFRVAVRSATTDRQMVVLGVKIAELRKDALRNLGVSYRAVDVSGERLIRGGQGIFRTDDPFNVETGRIDIENPSFFTLLTDFGTRELIALIQAEEQRGTARILAEPSLAVADRDSASFLAGGELPIPIPQGGANAGTITILFKEFGVRLGFRPEILNDTLIKLRVEPEVSNLDFANAITLQGFRIPAFRTRRVNTTVDVRRSQSLVISGLFNDEREKVRTGIPFLSQIPVLGALFGSTRWLNNETELVVIVTPYVFDPRAPRPQDLPRIVPDTTLPAGEVLREAKRIAPPAAQAPARPAAPPARPPQPRQP